MQTGYGGGGGGGGVSEIQQFMVDTIGGGGGASLFPNAAGSAPPTSAALADLHFHHHRPYHLHHPQPTHLASVPPPPSSQFQHFHSTIPITQQLFHHPQFQLFDHHHHQQEEEQRRRRQQLQQLGLDCQDSGPEHSSSPTGPMIGGGGGGNGGAQSSFLTAAMNFKLAVNESSGGAGGGNDDDSMLHSGAADAEEESSIKEPFWRPLDLDFINNGSKRGGKDKPPESPHKYFKRMKESGCGEHEQGNSGGNNYKLFSELEAIYKPGGSGSGCGGGSGSALTGENPGGNEPLPMAGAAIDQHHVTSDTSTGALEATAAAAKSKKLKRKKRRRRHHQLRSVVTFFEGLVKQLMEHQESLHKKFLESMEKRDSERAAREEAWWQQQAANASREATARSRDRAVAAAREAAIITLLEKLTGETLVLPTNLDDKATPEFMEDSSINIDFGSGGAAATAMNSSRWPKAEVQALIRVRSGLEVRFQEPGLKGPLWEEVSSLMAAMGYKRSSKRCKEKWENINKYFRKTKDSGKKRSRHSKTCPYFDELDQLYSSKYSGTVAGVRKDCSELLDAIVESTENPSTTTIGNTTRFDNNNGEEENEDDEDDDEDDEHESDHERFHGTKKVRRQIGGGDSDNNVFFQRLES